MKRYEWGTFRMLHRMFRREEGIIPWGQRTSKSRDMLIWRTVRARVINHQSCLQTYHEEQIIRESL